MDGDWEYIYSSKIYNIENGSITNKPSMPRRQSGIYSPNNKPSMLSCKSGYTNQNNKPSMPSRQSGYTHQITNPHCLAASQAILTK